MRTVMKYYFVVDDEVVGCVDKFSIKRYSIPFVKTGVGGRKR
jgi:hypothetical protein